ncbi:MAG: antibiotic biosynthesis monooxygenase [Propionibacteriales bacterium]|nr:antibiotic biosynthesis monooxygenase [Propionibacteriales bacterium]
MSVRIVLEMRVLDSCEPADFLREWDNVSKAVATFSGNLGQALGRSLLDDRIFFVTSDWIDEPSFRAFETSERQDELTAGLRSLRASARMNVQQILIEHKGDRP